MTEIAQVIDIAFERVRRERARITEGAARLSRGERLHLTGRSLVWRDAADTITETWHCADERRARALYMDVDARFWRDEDKKAKALLVKVRP